MDSREDSTPLIRLWCDEYAIAMDMGLQWALSDATVVFLYEYEWSE